MLDLFGERVNEGYLKLGDNKKALTDPCYLICLR